MGGRTFSISAVKPDDEGNFRGDFTEGVESADEMLAIVKQLVGFGYRVHLVWPPSSDDDELVARLTEIGVVINNAAPIRTGPAA